MSADISLLLWPFSQIYSSHISHWLQYPDFSVSSIQGILQILQVAPSNSSSSPLSSFDDLARFLKCHDGLGSSSSWGIYTLITVPDGIFNSSSFLLIFCWPYFAATNFESLFHWDIRAFLGYYSRTFPQCFFCVSMGNSYCKKDYNKVEVNVAKITKIRLQKLKEHVASCCLVRKIWKKKFFLLL